MFAPFIPEANRALDHAAAFVRRATSRATNAATQPSSVTSSV
jgi:monoterpene epsilon-lactone hydrolase